MTMVLDSVTPRSWLEVTAQSYTPCALGELLGWSGRGVNLWLVYLVPELICRFLPEWRSFEECA